MAPFSPTHRLRSGQASENPSGFRRNHSRDRCMPLEQNCNNNPVTSSNVL